MLHIKRTGNVVGIISVVFFLLCMWWGLLFTDPVLRDLHANLLRIAYPGFTMSVAGAGIGVVESFGYGWVLGAFFAWLCNSICVSEEK